MRLRSAIASARPTTPAFIAIAVFSAGLGLAGLHAKLSEPAESLRLAANAELVGRIGLTDLALFTEARYTRHPSMADLHTAFQDHPASFEHFPSGIFVPPPTGLASGTLSNSIEDLSQ